MFMREVWKMKAEEIANDTSRNWDERIRAAAEIEHFKSKQRPKRKYDSNPLSLADRAYIARYHAYDGSTNLAALYGKRRQYIDSLVTAMKRSGEYDMYRNLTDEDYEKIINSADRRGKTLWHSL